MICPEDVLAITLSLRVQISHTHDSKLAFIGSYSTITILYLLNIPPMHDKNTNACCADIKSILEVRRVRGNKLKVQMWF